MDMGLRLAVMMMVAALSWMPIALAETATVLEGISTSESKTMLNFGRIAQGLAVAIVVSVLVAKLRAPRMKLPPGPIALPVVGNWLQVGNDLNHQKLAELTKKYGDVFMLKMGQRNLVVVSSPESAKDVLHTQGVAFGSRVCNVVFDIFSGHGNDVAFTNYGDHWRKMRRIMTVPFFTTKSVQGMHAAWVDEIDHVIDDLSARPECATEGVVIRTRLQLMIYNVMYRMMFNTRFESEQDPLFVKLRALNLRRSQVTQSFDYNYGDFIPVLRPFLRGFLRVCRDVNEKRNAMFKGFLEDRQKFLAVKGPDSATTKAAGIDHILDAQKKGEIEELNVICMIENVNAAGTETTLWGMEWSIVELVNKPDLQSRIRDELDTVLGKGQLICEADTHNNKLPYLSAFVKEVMRLHMIVPLLLPHLNLEAAKIAGYDIPAQSRIYVNSWWLANNPKYWDEPERFNPERFLNSSIDMVGNDFKFLPFGAGRRACPGSIIAISLLPLVLGRLIQSFELLPPKGTTKLDSTGLFGQFSNRPKTYSRVILKPIETVI